MSLCCVCVFPTYYSLKCTVPRYTTYYYVNETLQPPEYNVVVGAIVQEWACYFGILVPYKPYVECTFIHTGIDF